MTEQTNKRIPNPKGRGNIPGKKINYRIIFYDNNDKPVRIKEYTTVKTICEDTGISRMTCIRYIENKRRSLYKKHIVIEKI